MKTENRDEQARPMDNSTWEGFQGCVCWPADQVPSGFSNRPMILELTDRLTAVADPEGCQIIDNENGEYAFASLQFRSQDLARAFLNGLPTIGSMACALALGFTKGEVGSVAE